MRGDRRRTSSRSVSEQRWKTPAEHFVGIDLSRESVADATTRLKFRRQLLDTDDTQRRSPEDHRTVRRHVACWSGLRLYSGLWLSCAKGAAIGIGSCRSTTRATRSPPGAPTTTRVDSTLQAGAVAISGTPAGPTAAHVGLSGQRPIVNRRLELRSSPIYSSSSYIASNSAALMAYASLPSSRLLTSQSPAA